MDILNKKQKIIIIGIATFMLLFIGFYIINKTNNSDYIELEVQEEPINENEGIEEELEIEKRQNIIIHVAGAVKKEGIVELEEGMRISDVIEAAGGTTNEADLSKINLAYKVEDGQKVYVPSINDKIDLESITDNAGENVIEEGSNKSTEKVNINTASQTELETLSGVGPSTALKIINFREENGNFKKIEDIKNVPGIGESKYESLKENICVK